MYVARKLDQMDALGKLARSTRDPLRRYELEMNIAREFFAFSFDSTQFYLKHCQELARDVLDDQDLYNETSVLLGHLYAKAGSYLEASQLLYGGLDTATFSKSLMGEYLWDLYDYSKDLAGNSGMVEKLSIPPAASFRPRLYQLLPKDSDRWRSVLRDEFMDQGKLASADSVNRLLLATVKPEDRDYAIFAYFESEIENLKGNQPERIAWLILARGYHRPPGRGCAVLHAHPRHPGSRSEGPANDFLPCGRHAGRPEGRNRKRCQSTRIG